MIGTGKAPWWRTEVVYQIYPRSFQDANHDGVGDLPGVTRRLDYLQDLGVGALWLSPIFPSPMFDFGYDVSDYTDIGPEFGTLADFKTLLTEAHRRNIRIILDLVLNHTSHRHPWFREASASRDNPRRDWYIWRDARPGGGVPNNWQAAFGGRAWEWSPETGQYYLHSFLKEQPDVNWRHPGLKKAMRDVVRFWLDLGVDGFRLDVVNWFIKDAGFRDNPKKLLGLRPYDRQFHLYDRNRPETLDIMEEIRSWTDEYPDWMTVGEVYTEPPGNPDLVASYYAHGRGLHLAFNFAFLFCPWRAGAFADAVDRWESLLGKESWPNYTLSNHDQVRAFSRYAKKDRSQARARVAAAMLLTLRGTPFLYYGEEIGMKNGRVPRRRLQDPLGRRYWPFHAGRDGERTPMQWDGSKYAGFSTADPWLPVNDDFPSVNVAVQNGDPDSLLNWHRFLIALRQAEPALHRGDYRRLPGPEDVFCYERSVMGSRVFVALNFGSNTRTIPRPDDGPWSVLAGSAANRAGTVAGDPIRLEGYEVFIAKSTNGRDGS